MIRLYEKLIGRINSNRKIPQSVTELYLKTKKYLPKSPIILEAGAHMGFDTFGLAKVWSNGFVYAFEPVPDLYEKLFERLEGLVNAKCYNLALGKENGKIEMHISSGFSTASSSILRPTAHLDLFPTVTFDKKITVPIRRLKDWAIDAKVSRIDLLWLDMQGYEVYALEGAGDLLQNVSVIYTELCRTELYSGLIVQDDYIAFLKKFGFELQSITGDGEVNEGIFINKNAIASRKRS